MQYELFYLVGERQEANLETIREAVSKMLTEEGANLLDGEATEKRKLAYEIKHQNKGTYVTRRFELEDIDFWADEKNGEREFGIASINNKLNLNNDVLRHMIVKTEDLPEPGAKERRKAQEMAAQKAQGPVPRKEAPKFNERREAPRTFVKPTPAPAPKAEIKEVKKEESAKDIDKQLDKLLNI